MNKKTVSHSLNMFQPRRQPRLSYHMISYDTISYLMISYHMISDQMLSYHMISYQMLSWYMISHHISWYHMIWYHMIWYQMAWYHMIWHHIIWYHIIWYDKIRHDMSINTVWLIKWACKWSGWLVLDSKLINLQNDSIFWAFVGQKINKKYQTFKILVDFDKMTFWWYGSMQNFIAVKSR